MFASGMFVILVPAESRRSLRPPSRRELDANGRKEAFKSRVLAQLSKKSVMSSNRRYYNVFQLAIQKRWDSSGLLLLLGGHYLARRNPLL